MRFDALIPQNISSKISASTRLAGKPPVTDPRAYSRERTISRKASLRPDILMLELSEYRAAFGPNIHSRRRFTKAAATALRSFTKNLSQNSALLSTPSTKTISSFHSRVFLILTFAKYLAEITDAHPRRIFLSGIFFASVDFADAFRYNQRDKRCLMQAEKEERMLLSWKR